MTAQGYQELIMEGVKGLPTDILAEVADFVYFVRKRALQPPMLDDELRIAVLRAELKQFSREEIAHLEGEFANYEQLYPRE
jgi:hypothetical protein